MISAKREVWRQERKRRREQSGKQSGQQISLGEDDFYPSVNLNICEDDDKPSAESDDLYDFFVLDKTNDEAKFCVLMNKHLPKDDIGELLGTANNLRRINYGVIACRRDGAFAGSFAGAICCGPPKPGRRGLSSIEIYALRRCPETSTEGLGIQLLKRQICYLKQTLTAKVELSVPLGGQCHTMAWQSYKTAGFQVTDTAKAGTIIHPMIIDPLLTRESIPQSSHVSDDLDCDFICDGKCGKNYVACKRCHPVLQNQGRYLAIVNAGKQGCALQAKELMRSGTVIGLYHHAQKLPAYPLAIHDPIDCV